MAATLAPVISANAGAIGISVRFRQALVLIRTALRAGTATRLSRLGVSWLTQRRLDGTRIQMVVTLLSECVVTLMDVVSGRLAYRRDVVPSAEDDQAILRIVGGTLVVPCRLRLRCRIVAASTRYRNVYSHLADDRRQAAQRRRIGQSSRT